MEMENKIENTKKIVEQKDLLSRRAGIRLADLEAMVEQEQEKLEKEQAKVFKIAERERNLDKKEKFIMAKYEKAGITYD